MLKLLIAIDGSEHARQAIVAAARLGKEVPRLDVVLLNVGEMSHSLSLYDGPPPYDYEAIQREERTRQEDLLEAALTQARACGLEHVVTQSAVGAPAQEIVRVAAEHGADQIVMGTRGMNPLAGLLLGSVAQRVVHLAETPVLLVK
jgi:nucleotide-binding universal stress UspA family protein